MQSKILTTACVILLASLTWGCEDELSSGECMDYQDRWEELTRARRLRPQDEAYIVRNQRAIHGEHCSAGRVTREQYECVLSPITRTSEEAVLCTYLE